MEQVYLSWNAWYAILKNEQEVKLKYHSKTTYKKMNKCYLVTGTSNRRPCLVTGQTTDFNRTWYILQRDDEGLLSSPLCFSSFRLCWLIGIVPLATWSILIIH